MSWSDALLRYAKTANPETLPSDVYITHDDHTLTVQDLYPKATFHWLCLPRLPFTVEHEGSETDVPEKTLLNLEALAKSKLAVHVLKRLKVASETVMDMMRIEMLELHKTTWPIHCGFHAAESMTHVHLHIISEDLCSDKLKNKKHYNSFNPKLGFFLHLGDVLRWAEEGSLLPSSPFDSNRHLPSRSKAEQLLKEPLVSFRSGQTYSNIPKLKDHLDSAFKADLRRRKALQEDDDEPRRKKPKVVE